MEHRSRNFAAVVLLAACSAACELDSAASAGEGAGDASAADVSRDADGEDGAASEVDAEPPRTVAGCDEALFLEASEDPGAEGPWPVGARTVPVGRLTVEVWYPATPGTEADAEPVRYDLRDALPPSEQETIPDEENPWQACACYRDLPLDAERGPYPVVVFVHGTAAFRTQSLSQMEHWASRGFVVVAANHPGLVLSDALSIACPDEPGGARDLAGDVDAILAALSDPSGEFGFLGGHLDLERIGLAGHSAGGNAVADLADRAGVRVVIPMAASKALVDSDTLAETLFLAGAADGIVPAESTVEAFEETSGPRRLGILDNAAHLAFSDLCALVADDGRNLVEVAEANGVCGTEFAGILFDCDPSLIEPERAIEVVSWLSTAVLEQHLQCADRTATLDGAQDTLPHLETWRALGDP